MRKATMRDVSEATGFSMFTVSRALNGGDGVADDSRELILKVARELGYVPNRAAQALRLAAGDAPGLLARARDEAPEAFARRFAGKGADEAYRLMASGACGKVAVVFDEELK